MARVRVDVDNIIVGAMFGGMTLYTASLIVVKIRLRRWLITMWNSEVGVCCDHWGIIGWDWLAYE